MELEGQIRQLQQVLQQQKEAEEELVARIGKLQEEKRELQDRLANFQRSLANTEQEKRELERAHVRLEKDKKALRNTLDKVSNVTKRTTMVEIRERANNFIHATVFLF